MHKYPSNVLERPIKKNGFIILLKNMMMENKFWDVLILLTIKYKTPISLIDLPIIEVHNMLSSFGYLFHIHKCQIDYPTNIENLYDEYIDRISEIKDLHNQNKYSNTDINELHDNAIYIMYTIFINCQTIYLFDLLTVNRNNAMIVNTKQDPNDKKCKMKYRELLFYIHSHCWSLIDVMLQNNMKSISKTTTAYLHNKHKHLNNQQTLKYNAHFPKQYILLKDICASLEDTNLMTMKYFAHDEYLTKKCDCKNIDMNCVEHKKRILLQILHFIIFSFISFDDFVKLRDISSTNDKLYVYDVIEAYLIKSCECIYMYDAVSKVYNKKN